MSDLSARTAALTFGLLLLGPAAGAVMIDDFGGGAPSLVTCPPVPGPPCTSDFQYSGGIILGGDREEAITNTSLGIIVAGATGGSYSYGNLNAAGSALLVWDGAGGSFPGVDATGLGGEDFTLGGHDAIGLRILSNDFAANVTLTVSTDAANWSTVTVATPGGIPAGPPFDLVIGHTSFVVGGGTGADFANVGAFTLEIDGSSAPLMNLTLDFVETTTIVPVPEPDTAALLALGLITLARLGRSRT